MYVKLKSDIKIQRSLNCIVLKPEQWKQVNSKQYEKLLPFSHVLDFTESLQSVKSEIVEIPDDDLSEYINKLKKSELIEYLTTNNISDKSEDELSKLNKSELLNITEGKE